MITPLKMAVLYVHVMIKQPFIIIINYLLLQIRDYIHVMGLADGHVAALKKLFTKQDIGQQL